MCPLLLLRVVIFDVLNTLLIILCVHIFTVLFHLLLLMLPRILLRGSLVLRQICKIQRGHDLRLFPYLAKVRPAIDRLVAVIRVEGEHKAALIIRVVRLLVLRHDIRKSARCNILNAFLFIEFIDRDTLVLKGKKEKEEFVFLVFVIGNSLFHLAETPLKGLQFNQQISLSISYNI